MKKIVMFSAMAAIAILSMAGKGCGGIERLPDPDVIVLGAPKVMCTFINNSSDDVMFSYATLAHSNQDQVAKGQRIVVRLYQSEVNGMDQVIFTANSLKGNKSWRLQVYINQYTPTQNVSFIINDSNYSYY